MSSRVLALGAFLPLLSACKGEAPPPASAPAPTPTASVQTAPSEPASAPAASAPLPAASAGPPDTTSALSFVAVPLPGAHAPTSLDYIAYEPSKGRVWVPVGDTGSVDVYDVASKTFSVVGGFKTDVRDVHGKKRTVGPSAVALGEGYAYVGNRATGEVCAVDTATLKVGSCLKLSSTTDGVAYVASTSEVWVTTPRDQSIAVLDATNPAQLKKKTVIRLSGAPEGYAVDPSRRLFFTNLEDKNKTVAIDLRTHAPKMTWSVDCGADGPRGVAADVGRGFVYVACTDHVVVLDGAHGGAPLGSIDTGPGLDNIDWFEPEGLVYAAAGKASKVTIARVDFKGQPAVVASGASVAGARNVVADARGNAYVIDPENARLLVFDYARAP